MRKRELEKNPPCILSSNREYTGGERVLEFEAQIIKNMSKDEILEIDLFEDGELIARHFIDKTKRKYTTQFIKAGFRKCRGYWSKEEYKPFEWSDVSFGGLITKKSRNSGYYINSYPHMFSSDTQEQIKKDRSIQESTSEYFAGDIEKGKNIFEEIFRIEYMWESEKRMTAKEKIQAGIVKRMETVDKVEMQEEFLEYIDNLFAVNYVYPTGKETEQGYEYGCCACKKKFFSKEKLKNLGTHICPDTKKTVMVKSRIMRKEMSEKKAIIINQKHGENTWLMRHFDIEVYSHLEGDEPKKRMTLSERIRVFKDQDKTQIYYNKNSDSFNIESQKELGRNRMKQIWSKTKSNIYFREYSYIYPVVEGIQDEAIASTLRICGKNNLQLPYNNWIRNFENRKEVEYIIKLGLFQLAKDCMEYSYSFDWHLNENRNLNGKSTKAEGVLGIDKQRVYRLRDINGGIKELKWLRHEKESGEKIEQEILLTVRKMPGVSEYLLRLIQDHKLRTNKTVRYLVKQKRKTRMNTGKLFYLYRDYLNMSKELEQDLTDSIVAYPRDIKEAHDRATENLNRRKYEEQDKRDLARNKVLKKVTNEIKEIVEFSTDKYTIILPEKLRDIREEGRQLHHCVGAGDRYIDKMLKKKSIIAFLRRTEETQKPYYTLEIKADTWEVLQCRSEYNRQPDYEVIKTFLKKWNKHVKTTLNEIRNGQQETTKTKKGLQSLQAGA